MNNYSLSISNNLLRIVYNCKIHSRTQIIPLKYITSVECYDEAPSRLVIQYNTLHQFNRTVIEYSSYDNAMKQLYEIQKGLETVYTQPQPLLLAPPPHLLSLPLPAPTALK